MWVRQGSIQSRVQTHLYSGSIHIVLWRYHQLMDLISRSFLLDFLPKLWKKTYQSGNFSTMWAHFDLINYSEFGIAPTIGGCGLRNTWMSKPLFTHIPDAKFWKCFFVGGQNPCLQKFHFRHCLWEFKWSVSTKVLLNNIIVLLNSEIHFSNENLVTEQKIFCSITQTMSN